MHRQAYHDAVQDGPDGLDEMSSAICIIWEVFGVVQSFITDVLTMRASHVTSSSATFPRATTAVTALNIAWISREGKVTCLASLVPYAVNPSVLDRSLSTR